MPALTFPQFTGINRIRHDFIFTYICTKEKSHSSLSVFIKVPIV